MESEKLKILKTKLALEKEMRKKKPETKLQKLLKSPVQNKQIFKKSERGTVVFNKEIPQRSKHFKEEFEKARWL